MCHKKKKTNINIRAKPGADPSQSKNAKTGNIIMGYHLVRRRIIFILSDVQLV